MLARAVICGLCLCVGLGAASTQPASTQPAGNLTLIRIEGAIGPATASYIARAIEESAGAGAECLIIQLDTPGGLLDSTKTIVQKLLSSPVPTVVYVAPAGAGAVSAGCFITLASDVAAMAPATNIGAAHPVELGGGGSAEEKADKTMSQKVENYAATFIESIAARRKRNVEWARSAVRESASITAERALELKVIDLVAEDLPDLLKQLDGRQVGGKVLRTDGASISEIPMSLRESVFQMMWRPEVLFILMLIAVYGIIGELSNPGAILPGVIGAIALILALYLAAVLPVNIAGLVLIALAVVLFVADALTPAHGVLTAGGIAAFLVGSLMLFDRTDPVFRLSLTLIIPATVLTAAFFVFIVGAGLRAQRLPVKVGLQTLIGRITPAITRIDSAGGKVSLEGEYWNAVSQQPIEQGQLVEVVDVVGLTLNVKPKPSEGTS